MKPSSLRTFLALALLVAGHALILTYMGRIVWCGCGELILWKGEAWSNHTSQHLLDPYSFSHVQHGMIFFLVLFLCRVPTHIGLWVAACTEIAWEILENTNFIIDRYRAATASLDYFGDSIGNSVGDLLCCLFGFFIAQRLPWRATLGLYGLIEVGMLLSIRDCLSLNVLMLLYPIEAIKQWQIA